MSQLDLTDEQGWHFLERSNMQRIDFTITDDLFVGWADGVKQDLLGIKLRRKDLTRNIFFLFYGPKPPWVCEFCQEKILFVGQGAEALHIHHKDENKNNNRIANLAPMHGACHVKHHHIEKNKVPAWALIASS